MRRGRSSFQLADAPSTVLLQGNRIFLFLFFLVWKSKAAGIESEALFSSKKFCKINTVALSFVFDKNCPIMD